MLNNSDSSVLSLCRLVIEVSEKFIEKVDKGKARSVETYSDMKKLREKAILLQEELHEEHERFNR